jgi:hypothetical protein
VEEKMRAFDQQGEEYIQWHDKAVLRVRQGENSRYKH